MFITSLLTTWCGIVDGDLIKLIKSVMNVPSCSLSSTIWWIKFVWISFLFSISCLLFQTCFTVHSLLIYATWWDRYCIIPNDTYIHVHVMYIHVSYVYYIHVHSYLCRYSAHTCTCIYCTCMCMYTTFNKKSPYSTFYSVVSFPQYSSSTVVLTLIDVLVNWTPQ